MGQKRKKYVSITDFTGAIDMKKLEKGTVKQSLTKKQSKRIENNDMDHKKRQAIDCNNHIIEFSEDQLNVEEPQKSMRELKWKTREAQEKDLSNSLNDKEMKLKMMYDAETQTDEDHSRRESSCQTALGKKVQKFTMETQTVDIEGTAHVGRNLLRQEVVLEVPEELLEMIPSKPSPEPLQAITELIETQTGSKTEFNFIGAFLDFHNMATEEIIKIQSMLEGERFEICQRAIYARRFALPKFSMSA